MINTLANQLGFGIPVNLLPIIKNFSENYLPKLLKIIKRRF